MNIIEWIESFEFTVWGSWAVVVAMWTIIGTVFTFIYIVVLFKKTTEVFIQNIKNRRGDQYMPTYIVCQTGHCQQTYPLEYFGVVTKDTKDIKCEKCGGILVDSNGKAQMSQNATVIPVIIPAEQKEKAERRLEQKREEYKQLEREMAEIEQEIEEYS